MREPDESDGRDALEQYAAPPPKSLQPDRRQIQILLLLRELQREFGMSVIFAIHDIGVAVGAALPCPRQSAAKVPGARSRTQ